MTSELVNSVSESNIRGVINRNVLFTVPDYQRLYSWEEEHWDAFWRDLIDLDEDETHFLGSIVVIEHSGGFGKLDEYELVDGQQRLTTISLLLKAIQEKYEQGNDPNDIAEKIETDYLHETDPDNVSHVKLSLSKFENDNYKHIINEEYSKVDKESQLWIALEHFRSLLDDLDIDEVNEIRKRLVLSMDLVVIQCSNTASAFRLFETLNDRGLELSAVDLMKNSLLQVAANKYGSGSSEYEHIRSQWEEVLDRVVYEIDNPDRFFRQYIMSREEPDIPGSVTSRKLYDIFSDIIENKLPANGVDLVDYVEGMVDTADIYVGFVRGEVDMFQGRNQKKIEQSIQNLNDIGSSHSRTLLIRTFEELDDFAEINKVLGYLEVFMLRWKVANYQSGTNLDSIFSGLCSNAFGSDDPVNQVKIKLQDEAPSDEEVRAGFANDNFSRNAQTKYILDMIEQRHYMPASGGGGKSYNRATVDIEHIAPQSTFNWPKYSNWRDVIGVDEGEFDKYRNRLGNLTLLEDSLNEEASDDPFRQKKDQYKLSDFEMTQAIREEYDQWTYQEIEDRSESLADLGVNIWDFDRF